MDEIKLIYFNGCPEAKNVRRALLVGGIYDFEVIVQDNLPSGDPYLKFSSPSVLAGSELIYGIRTDGEKASCTFDVINFVDDQKLIERFREVVRSLQRSTNEKRSYTSFLGTAFSTLLVFKCPACIPGAVAFLSALGMSFLITPTILKSILISMLSVTLFALGISFLKAHRNIYPLLLGISFSVALYIGRFHYFDSMLNLSITYIAIAGLVLTSLWDLKLKLVKKCPACR
jgi:hypothetical protein